MADSNTDKNKNYKARLKSLEDQRRDALLYFKKISDYVLPTKGMYISEGQNPDNLQDRYKNIIDPTATRANGLLGAGMQGGLTSPSRPWFRIMAEDEGLMKFDSVAQWCSFVEKAMYGVFKRSNFYSSVHQDYEENAAFGTAPIFMEEDFEDLVRFYVLVPGTYCIAISDNGKVTTLFRRFWMTALQIMEKFGVNNVSSEVERCVSKTTNTPYKWFEVLHVIEPRRDRDIMKIDGSNMPYASVYMEMAKNDKLLAESGFNERPFACPRWAINGAEIYGNSPGWLALGPTIMLQSLQKSSLKAIHKEVDPPMRVPMSFKDKLNMLPGGKNYVGSNDGRDSVGKLFDMNFDYPGCEAKIERIQGQIERIFFNDLFFTILNRPEMTATEVVQRHEEQLIMLGPVIERQITELLDPVIERTFNIMQRANMIPPVPRELENSSLKIDYISLLAQAQKMMGLQHMDMYLNMTSQISTIPADHPVAMKTDYDAFQDEYALRLGIDPTITRDPRVVAQMKLERQQAIEKQQQLEMLGNTAGDIKQLSQSDTEGKNALTDIMEAVS